MNKGIPLILHFKSNIYEFPLPNTFKGLIEHCEKLIASFSREAIVFNYLDSEGEMVQIASEYDYDQAIIYLESTIDEVFVLSAEEFKDDNKNDESFERTNDIVRNFYKMKIKEKALKAMKFDLKLRKHFVDLLNKKISVSNKIAFESIKKYSSTGSSSSNQIESDLRAYDIESAVEQYIMQFFNEKSIETTCKGIKQEIISDLSDGCRSSSFLMSSYAGSRANEALMNTNQTVHHGINCSLCNASPIKGIRYKCSVCSYYNLCQKCEENNYLNAIHSHDLLKLKQIESNAYQCLTNQLSFTIDKGLTTFTVPLVIRNTSLKPWQSHNARFVCNCNSTLIANDSICHKQNQIGQELQYNINFANMSHLQCGSYLSIINLSIDHTVYDPPILIEVTIVQHSP